MNDCVVLMNDYSSVVSPSVPLVAKINMGPNVAPLSVLTLMTGVSSV
jgi:hypothetical protein